MCVCSLSYPATQSACAVVYCNLWPLWLHHVFRHFLINGTVFGKEVIGHKMCVLIFSAAFVWNISDSEKNSASCYHKCENVFTSSTRCSCQILMKFKFSGHMFWKFSNIKFRENPSSGNRVVPCGQTDMTSLIVAFGNFANAPNK